MRAGAMRGFWTGRWGRCDGAAAGRRDRRRHLCVLVPVGGCGLGWPVTVDLVALRKYADDFRRGYPPGASVVAIDPDELLTLIEAVEAARALSTETGSWQALRAALVPFEARQNAAVEGAGTPESLRPPGAVGSGAGSTAAVSSGAQSGKPDVRARGEA